MDKYELGRILKDMYSNAPNGEMVTQIHLFGIDYANYINAEGGKISAKDIAILAKINESYATEISKGIKLAKYVSRKGMIEKKKSHSLSGGVNKIYFGAPGTGKSRYVENMYNDGNAKRIIFHPEYTYNDFVGYIKPITQEKEITYSFVPGTFTEILVEALKNPNNMYSLIIEEINRANTSAVFGDLFQLLDRKDNGESEYRVNNTEIYKYILDSIGDTYKYSDESIYIPSNLNIIATMNTADQNIFVMDTAFKRRWEFEYIPIEFKDNHSFKNKIITNLNITWEAFVNILNEFMMSKENEDLMISEDKQLGQYFIKENELTNANKFGYKVLLYLWYDVFKMDRYKLFNEDIRTFSQLMLRFNSQNSIDIFNKSIVIKLEEHKNIQNVINQDIRYE